jgi:hypothetical protein
VEDKDIQVLTDEVGQQTAGHDPVLAPSTWEKAAWPTGDAGANTGVATASRTSPRRTKFIRKATLTSLVAASRP